VDTLRASGALREAPVEQAFRRVPRHLFVGRFFVGSETEGWTEIEHDPEHPRPEHLEKIYSGAALITRLQDNLGTSSLSQPALMADMLQLLDVRQGMRVLEPELHVAHAARLIHGDAEDGERGRDVGERLTHRGRMPRCCRDRSQTAEQFAVAKE